MEVTDVVGRGDDPSGYESLARRVTGDAILYAGLGDAYTGPLLDELGGSRPGALLLGASALATTAPAGLPALLVVKPALPAAVYGPDAQRILGRLRRSEGAEMPPEALYGYESMKVVLDAMDAAAPAAGDRAAVLRAALEPRRRRGVTGAYRVLPSGGVSRGRLGWYRRGEDGLSYLGRAGTQAR
jgi:branched-chain amino acid transport system substrate-binding protein